MLFFSTYLNHPAAVDIVFTQPLSEMIIRGKVKTFWGSAARPVRGADNLISICEPIV
jgi:hypothetical protein